MIRRHIYTEREINYDNYNLSVREYILSGIFIICVSGLYSYVFYKSLIAFLVMILPSYFYIKIIKKILAKRRLQVLTLQFKELCLSLSAQLVAGYSLENSLIEVYRELSQIYGENSYICVEVKNMIFKLKINIVIEECFADFATRSNIEDIRLFAEVVGIAKKSGGDMIEIVRNTANSICRKIEVEREINIIINGKKYEQSIMNIVPLILVLYMGITSPDMMETMYTTVMGRIVMTVCLVVYILAFYIGTKIVSIEV
jgi:tight adherence protein B